MRLVLALLPLLIACGSDPHPATTDASADTSTDTGPPPNTCHLGADRCTFGLQCVRVNGMPRCVVLQDIDNRRVCPTGQCAAGDADAGFSCAPLTTCGLTCEGVLTSREHCGACYSPCTGTTVCRNGQCVAP